VATATVRAADVSDLEGVTETLWLAFRGDPLWSWAFPEHAQLLPFWRLLVGSALAHEWVWVLGDYAAASVWIPPGRRELSEAQEAQASTLLDALLGERADEVEALLERFDGAHPRSEPHFYLSLLGTHPERRGEGLGMKLLASNLQRIDALGSAAYLESSNPVNDRRYESVGFERVGAFQTPDGARSVTTMWRPPAAGAGRPPASGRA